MAERRITIDMESFPLHGECTAEPGALAPLTDDARAKVWERLYPLLADGRPERGQLALIDSQVFGSLMLDEGRRLEFRLRCTVEPA
jgi:hypothetical protein